MIDLRKLRKTTGLGVNEAAKRLGVTPTTLWRWESGRNSPPLDILPTVLKIYSITDEEILDLLKEQAS